MVALHSAVHEAKTLFVDWRETVRCIEEATDCSPWHSDNAF